MGLFNVLTFVAGSGRQAARSIAESLGVSWEEWSLDGRRIVDCGFGGPGSETAVKSAGRFPGQPTAFHAAMREYRVLIGTASLRAERFSPELGAELSVFDASFRKALAIDRVPVVSRLGSLVTVNGALSRLSSQCLSGTSPIFETESHYWTHSLLGIGIPCMAIASLRRFSETVLGRVRFGDRLKMLKERTPHTKPLWNLPSRDPFWKSDILFPPDRELPPVTSGDSDLPLITFFSGRDGNRSTSYSLSVPLEVVSSCNATAWTLRTITHELSHTIIDLVQALLLPKPEDKVQLARTVAVLRQKPVESGPPVSLFDQLRAYLCHSLVVMDSETVDDISISWPLLADRIRRRTPHLNEILTHVFDFLYFYRKDPKSYIRSLWASWAVIPNIHARIPEYLVRSLCALMANNLTRAGGVDITYEQLEIQLGEVKKEFPEAAYLDEATEKLGTDRESLVAKLEQRVPLIRFVRFVLFAPGPDEALARDPLAGGSSAGRYDLVVDEFDEKKVTSPLSFVEHFSSDAIGSETKSAWMLHKLAFAHWNSNNEGEDGPA